VTWPLIVAAWLAGAGVAWAFIAGATRCPSPEPFGPLDDLRDLARRA